MTKFEWGIVVVAVGAGVLSQIPNHDDMEMDGQEYVMPAMEAAAGMEVVSLAITGMT